MLQLGRRRATAMQIPVLVEPTSENRFRATAGDPLKMEAEATTREEAVRKLCDLLQRRVDAGAEVVGVEVHSTDHPLAAFAGTLKDEPLLEAWREARAEYRNARESDTP
jgi:hypothetical protein